jgi:hypothetical protein
MEVKMSVAEMLDEIHKLTPEERQSLMLELKRQEHLDKSRVFAAEFEGVTEAMIYTPLEMIEPAGSPGSR